MLEKRLICPVGIGKRSPFILIVFRIEELEDTHSLGLIQFPAKCNAQELGLCMQWPKMNAW